MEVVVIVLAVPAAPRVVCSPLSASMASSTISLLRVKALSHFNLKKERKKERKKRKERKKDARLFLGCPTLISSERDFLPKRDF